MEAGDEPGIVMSEKKRKVFSGEFKAKVALEAVRGVKTVNEIALDFGVHPTQVGQWKRELQEQAGSLFEARRSPKPVDESASPERLYSEIGRLMGILGLAGMAPGPDTSRQHPQHKTHPYLLRGVEISRPNHVWSADITYIRLARGFVYLVAVIDWYSRKVLAWRVSNTLDSGFCVDCLGQALQEHGIPEIFNSDQGCQFTSEAFTGVLKAQGIAISMDGRGRALDNIFVERLWRSVKHEDVYLRDYASVPELLLGLAAHFEFFNSERFHQSLGYLTPDEVYRTSSGGGARIVDKFGEKETVGTEPKTKTGQRCSAASSGLPS